LGILDTSCQDLVREEAPQLVSNFLRVAVNENGGHRFGHFFGQSGIEFVASPAMAIEANALHCPAGFFDLVALAAIQPLLAVGSVEGLRNMEIVVEVDAGILFDVAGPDRANGRLAGILDDGESNRWVVLPEVARIIEVGAGKLCREVTVAAGAIGRTLVCE
jgi:hypothetical protein